MINFWQILKGTFYIQFIIILVTSKLSYAQPIPFSYNKICVVALFVCKFPANKPL